MGGEMFVGYEKGDTYRPTSIGLFPTNEINQDEALKRWVNSFNEIENTNIVIHLHQWSTYPDG
jgi:hypothetical protein